MPTHARDMLLDSRAGTQTIPRRWLDGLTARATIERLITRIDPAVSHEPGGKATIA